MSFFFNLNVCVYVLGTPKNSPADNRHNISEPGFAVYRKCFD